MLVVPAVLDDVRRNVVVVKLVACLGPALQIALPEELSGTRCELRPYPGRVRVQDHRDVICLPVPVHPGNDAADLNGAVWSPERRAASSLPSHLIEVEE